MDALDFPGTIVARFLKANHYNDTLRAFIQEARLPLDAGEVNKGDLTLERILEEKKTFDRTLQYQKCLQDNGKQWTTLAPLCPFEVRSLPTTSNLLYVGVDAVLNEEGQGSHDLIIATTADRRYSTLHTNLDLQDSHIDLHDSPILSQALLDFQSHVTITASMSGQVVVYDHRNRRKIDERYDHHKYVVNMATWPDKDRIWIATAGWDKRIFLYLTGKADGYVLGNPIASIETSSNPEAVLFVEHPDSEQPVLIVTRRDSTFLYYYKGPRVEDVLENRDNSRGPVNPAAELRLLGKQNLAPHSNAWIAFSPSSVALCPGDPSLLAIATSALPHMKLIIVRILWSCMLPQEEQTANPISQAAQAKADLATQDKEDAALRIVVSSMAPQTPFSTPQVAWRPDGSGLWVNGDDGALRGIEAKTGKIINTLRGGHDSGSKIRTLWCGHVKVEGTREEWIVSGGFDQKLIVWKPQSSQKSLKD